MSLADDFKRTDAQLEQQLACVVDESFQPKLTEPQVRLVANRVCEVGDGEHVGLYWCGPVLPGPFFVSVRPWRDVHGVVELNIQIDSAVDHDERLATMNGELFLDIADDFRRIREAVLERYQRAAIDQGRVLQ